MKAIQVRRNSIEFFIFLSLNISNDENNLFKKNSWFIKIGNKILTNILLQWSSFFLFYFFFFILVFGFVHSARYIIYPIIWNIKKPWKLHINLKGFVKLSNRILRIPYHIFSKILENSNSLLLVVDKERMGEFVD